MFSVNDINFRILAYELDVGIYVCDPEGNFIYANLALADIFNVDHPREIVGKNFKDFIKPDRATTFMERLRKSMLTREKSPPIWTEIISQDARTIYIEVNAMPFVKNQIIAGNQGVVHDITKFREAVENMMHTSTHDPLTGIFNRSFFEAEMKRLGRGRQYPISIIVTNVEGLQNFGVSEDHEGRDKIIIKIARQFFYAFRGDDIAARIGENEFGILFPNVDDNTVQKIMNRLQGELAKINKDDGTPPLEFYMGAGTANEGQSVILALKKAETIVDLKKRRSNPNL